MNLPFNIYILRIFAICISSKDQLGSPVPLVWAHEPAASKELNFKMFLKLKILMQFVLGITASQ